MRVASIDLGSNSFLCLVAEKGAHGELKELYDTIEFVKLGEGVQQNKKFSEGALKRAGKAFEKFKTIIEKYRPDKVVAVATSAARDVQNKEEFFLLAKKFNIPIKVISGQQEGFYTYQGVLSSRPQQPDFAVLDIGGGSTEIAYLKEKDIFSHSYDVGCVRLTERFLFSDPETSEEIRLATEHLSRALSSLYIGNRELVAVAGTPTTLASLHMQKDFDPRLVDRFPLKKEYIENLIKRFSGLRVEERKKLPGIDAPRADVIMAGALIILEAMKTLRREAVTVSTRGVRYGVAHILLNGGEL